MRIFIYEFRKLMRQKSVWAIWILCLLLNVVFLNVTEWGRYSYTPEMYQELERDLAGMTDEEAFRWLSARGQELRERAENGLESGNGESEYKLYTGNDWDDLDLLGDAAKEREAVLSYQDYLDGIQKDAETMLGVSIFQDSTGFSAGNIRKTAADFSKMYAVRPVFDTERGVTMATGFLPTDLVAVFFLFAMGVFLILSEKQQGLFELICHTSKGRRELLAAKLAVLAVCTVLFTAGLYAGNMISAGYTYGFGDPGRPLQSVGAYQGSILLITVGQYLRLFFLMKLFIYLVIGLMFLLICLWFRQLPGILLTGVGVLCASAACYYLIPENAAAFSLKYLNLFYFLRVDRLLAYYKNANLFGKPVGLLPAAIVICGVLACALVFAGMRVMCTQHIFRRGRNAQSARPFVKMKLPRFCSLSGFEYQKILKKTGAVFLLLLFLIFQCVRIAQYSYPADADEVYYRSYMRYLEGDVTARTDEYVREENARYEALLSRDPEQMEADEASRLHQDLLPYKAWQNVLAEYERVGAGRASGGKMQLIYDVGYRQLMGDNPRMDRIGICLMVILFGLCFASAFSGDSSIGMDLLLRTTPGGRRDTLRAKQKVAFSWASGIWLLINGADFLKIYFKLGMSGWDAPVQSLRLFADTEASMRIWQYFLLLYLLRFLGMAAMLYVLLGLSQWCRDSFRAVLFFMILFLLPAACGMLGADRIESLSLTPLLCGNTVLNELISDGNAIPVIVYPAAAAALLLLIKCFHSTVPRPFQERRKILWSPPGSAS